VISAFLPCVDTTLRSSQIAAPLRNNITSKPPARAAAAVMLLSRETAV
jgi:hypothetical protein